MDIIQTIAMLKDYDQGGVGEALVGVDISIRDGALVMGGVYSSTV
jgi:hypothetical protein